MRRWRTIPPLFFAAKNSGNSGVRISRSVALEEREDLGGPFGWLLEGRPVAAIGEEYEARVGDVVEDCDRDLERHHPVVAAMDQQDRRLYAGEVGSVVMRQARRQSVSLGELW